MTTYNYIPPRSTVITVFNAPYDPNSTPVGIRQAHLLRIARGSKTGTLVLSHSLAGASNRMAARRLVLRGLLNAPNAMGSGEAGWLYFYAITRKGRDSWLRILPVQSKKKKDDNTGG